MQSLQRVVSSTERMLSIARKSLSQTLLHTGSRTGAAFISTGASKSGFIGNSVRPLPNRATCFHAELPDQEVFQADGSKVRLSDLTKGKKVLLVGYVGAFTGVCQKQVCIQVPWGQHLCAQLLMMCAV